VVHAHFSSLNWCDHQVQMQQARYGFCSHRHLFLWVFICLLSLVHIAFNYFGTFCCVVCLVVCYYGAFKFLLYIRCLGFALYCANNKIWMNIVICDGTNWEAKNNKYYAAFFSNQVKILMICLLLSPYLDQYHILKQIQVKPKWGQIWIQIVTT